MENNKIKKLIKESVLKLINNTTADTKIEKIIGKQDTAVNNGAIVDKVTLQPKDGLLMLKIAQPISNLFFGNGYFLRFYKSFWQGALLKRPFSIDGYFKLFKAISNFLIMPDRKFF